jgi:hypothetical protein
MVVRNLGLNFEDEIVATILQYTEYLKDEVTRRKSRGVMKETGQI